MYLASRSPEYRWMKTKTHKTSETKIPDGIILNPVIICFFTCKYGLGIYIVIPRIIGLIIAKAGWV